MPSNAVHTALDRPMLDTQRTMNPHPPAHRLWPRLASGLVMLLVLLAVFALYTRPDFLVHMADQLWACF
jgi:uncharacterized RDD family membrane protein YckC